MREKPVKSFLIFFTATGLRRAQSSRGGERSAELTPRAQSSRGGDCRRCRARLPPPRVATVHEQVDVVVFLDRSILANTLPRGVTWQEQWYVRVVNGDAL